MHVALLLIEITVGVVSALTVWALWSRERNARAYDWHKVPGPKQLPLIGNLGAIIGSSHLHRVGDSLQLNQSVAFFGPCTMGCLNLAADRRGTLRVASVPSPRRTVMSSSEHIGPLESIVLRWCWLLNASGVRRCSLVGQLSMGLSSSGTC